MPDPGTVTRCELPEQEGITVISAVQSGSVVSPFYDNLVAQVIAHGSDRGDALDRLDAYLSEVRIEGLGTNVALLRRVLQDGEFQSGEHDVGYLGRLLERTDVPALMTEINELSGVRSFVDRSQITIETATSSRSWRRRRASSTPPPLRRARVRAGRRSRAERSDAVPDRGHEAVPGAVAGLVQP